MVWATSGLLILLLAGHSALWFVVTARIAEGVPGFVATAAASGWQIESGGQRRTGWPWRAAVELHDVVLTRPLGGTALRWSIERLDVAIRPDAPRILAVEAFGPQRVTLGDTAVQLTADTMALTVPLQGGPLDLTVRALAATQAGGPALQAARIDMRIFDLALTADAAGIALSPPFPAPFDGEADLTARVVATQPFPAADTPGQSAARWQAAAGRVDVPEFALHWGTLRLEGMGSGGLDPLLQPRGQATVRAQGALPVLDAAVRAGIVAPGPAAAARAVLGLLALAGGGGANGPVALPLVLQDRTLTVAEFALFRLPIVDWGSP